MPDHDLIFSKSAFTRFSHDLAGVIGAVSSSLSLLSELGGADKETLDLACGNADILMGRLRFFRAAFGNEGPLTDISVTRRILEEYLHTLENRVVRYSCVWQTDQEVPIFVFRLILLAGQIAAESLPRGGEITIKARAGDKEIRIEAKGKSIRPDPEIQKAADHDESCALSPKTVPAVFLLKCLEEQNWRLSMTADGESLIMLLNEKR